eukprot:m.150420 g.150420  ORF g.150420 m.150420 type:complete len:75 (-) comp30725_c0_seq3:370-594(-)
MRFVKISTPWMLSGVGWEVDKSNFDKSAPLGAAKMTPPPPPCDEDDDNMTTAEWFVLIAFSPVCDFGSVQNTNV